MLAQGGEFAFVLLSLARDLKVLPEELNKLLIIVVVISMALTPGLSSLGKYLADRVVEDDKSQTGSSHRETSRFGINDLWAEPTLESTSSKQMLTCWAMIRSTFNSGVDIAGSHPI